MAFQHFQCSLVNRLRMSSPDEILSREMWAAEYLKKAVSAILLEVGFDTTQKCAFEKLVALLEHFLVNLCRLTKSFGEVACRSQPMVNDVVLAAIEMGMNMQSLIVYGRRPYKVTIPVPPNQPPSMKLKPLNLGTQLPRPSYIPDHLPEFPDAHCYQRTPVHAAPVTGYQNIREHNAVLKRNMLKAATYLEAMMSHMEVSLFPDAPFTYPLISSTPKANHLYEFINQRSCKFKENPVTGRSSKRKRKSKNKVCIDLSDSHVVINNPYLRLPKVPPRIKGMSY